jgi:hypothetical protein
MSGCSESWASPAAARSRRLSRVNDGEAVAEAWLSAPQPEGEPDRNGGSKRVGERSASAPREL